MGRRGYACGVVPNAATESVVHATVSGRLGGRSDHPAIRPQPAGGVEDSGRVDDSGSVDDSGRGDGCVVLHLNGRLGADDPDRFRERADAALAAGCVRLIIDCAGLRELTGPAIGAFAALQRTLRQRGGDVALAALPAPAAEAFRLLGFADLFTVAADVDEAVSRLTAAGRPAPTALFPQVVTCPACAARLRTVKPGRFRCSQCQAVLAINYGAQVFAA